MCVCMCIPLFCARPSRTRPAWSGRTPDTGPTFQTCPATKNIQRSKIPLNGSKELHWYHTDSVSRIIDISRLYKYRKSENLSL